MSTISVRESVIRSWISVDILTGNVSRYGFQGKLFGFCISCVNVVFSGYKTKATMPLLAAVVRKICGAVMPLMAPTMR